MAKEILPNKDPEYWKHTVKCPHCFGRGRVCKEEYEFPEGTDTYKIIYEEEQAIEEVERIMMKKKCPKCHGEGFVKEVQELHGIPHLNAVICDRCNGTGEQP